MSTIKKKKPKKPRNPDALSAIVDRKGGPHKSKKHSKDNELWKQDIKE